MRENLSWLLTGAGAIVIIVIGFSGTLGTVIGCIFTPDYIQVGG